MTDPSGALVDAAVLRQRVEDSRLRIEAVQARAAAAKATLEGETTSVTSPDHSVTVTVGNAGTLVNLAFDRAAEKLPLPALARTVLATYRLATAQAVGKTEALLRELVGDDAGVLGLVRSSLIEQES